MVSSGYRISELHYRITFIVTGYVWYGCNDRNTLLTKMTNVTDVTRKLVVCRAKQRAFEVQKEKPKPVSSN